MTTAQYSTGLHTIRQTGRYWNTNGLFSYALFFLI